MLDADPVRELATKWLRHAGEDLHACRALVPIVDEVPSVIGSHAQQAIEKALKAVLVAEQIDFTRTHDLVAVAQLIPDPWDLELPSEPLASISRFAVEMRYPVADWNEGTGLGTADALAALEVAEAIVSRVAAVARRSARRVIERRGDTSQARSCRTSMMCAETMTE